MGEIQVLQMAVQEIKDKLDIIVHALMGNPEKPNELSILVRIDRLEQSNKYKNKILVLMGTGFLGMMCQFFISIL